jgi:starch-binding outer membrane protein SusE/F
MRSIFKIFLAVAGMSFFLISCDKIQEIPFHQNGNAVTLTASKTTIVPTAADSSNTVVTFSWTNPGYATDSATQKFILEIDSAGRNFSKEKTSIVNGALGISFTGKQLNDLLADFGFAPGQTFSFDIRVTSSYDNNNERLQSNSLKVTITSYLVPITLTPSSSNPLVLLVSNATNTAVSFNWNSSPYGSNTISYALQLDLAGNNFATPQVKQLGTALTTSFTVNDLNTMAIAAGVIGGSTKNVEFRIVSYLGAGYTTPLVNSSVVTLSITTFTPVPDHLYIVGDATPLGWNNNAGLSPSQEFTKVGAVSYSIVINLTAGGSYVFVPVAGDWTHKYGGASATGGPLLSDGAVPGSNTPAPAATGTYQITVNFQTGSYSVDPFVSTIPANLYIVGDATAGGWNNPVPTPSQQFTKLDAVSYVIIVNLTAGGSYLFLPVNGDWTHKYGGASATGGTLLADGAVPGSNTPGPATSGTYKIVVNFVTNTYSVTPYSLTAPDNLYIVGDATAGGWNNPVPTPAQQFTKINAYTYGVITNLTAGASYLFLPLNGDWTHKYGGASASGGAILADGAVPGSNTPAPATSGMYKILVDFVAGTYSVTPYTGPDVPDNLYIVGDATAGGWNNPVPTPSQQFTKLDNSTFELTLPLSNTGSYLFLPLNGDWTHKFGGSGATGGTLLADGAVPGSNTPGPAVSGSYKIVVNFFQGTYTVTP